MWLAIQREKIAHADDLHAYLRGLESLPAQRRLDFAAAEHSLSERMDYFRSIFTNVAGEIIQLNQSTRAALDEASSLAETIARHKKSLASSAGWNAKPMAGDRRTFPARATTLPHTTAL